MNNVLIHYLRDYNRVPFGCIVAIDKEHIGISIINPKDRFTKKFAREIAFNRALKRNDVFGVVPKYRKVLGYYGEHNYKTWSQPAIPMTEYVQEAAEYVKRRAAKYFKEEN
jgi:hypothetical protein